MTRHFSVGLRCAWLAILGICLAACRDDISLPPIPPLDQLLWTLELNHHAATLSTHAPHHTLQLTVIPRNASGRIVQIDERPVFRVVDSLVTVDSTGLVTAQYKGDNAQVIVTLVSNNIRIVDTVYINVTNVTDIPQADSLILVKPSSGMLAIPAFHSTLGLTYQMSADVYASQMLLTGTAVYYQSSDTSIVAVDRATGELFGKNTGTVTLYATGTIYGTTRRDSILCQVTHPVLGIISIENTDVTATWPRSTGFYPGSLTVSTGATMMWINRTLHGTDVIFDDGLHVKASPFDPTSVDGDIAIFKKSDVPQFFGSAMRARSFPVPGTYRYRSSNGATGEVIVKDF